jgi:hypothetical protein
MTIDEKRTADRYENEVEGLVVNFGAARGPEGQAVIVPERVGN